MAESFQYPPRIEPRFNCCEPPVCGTLAALSVSSSDRTSLQPLSAVTPLPFATSFSILLGSNLASTAYVQETLATRKPRLVRTAPHGGLPVTLLGRVIPSHLALPAFFFASRILRQIPPHLRSRLQRKTPHSTSLQNRRNSHATHLRSVLAGAGIFSDCRTWRISANAADNCLRSRLSMGTCSATRSGM